MANYIATLRAELLALSRSCGVTHPALVTPGHIEIVADRYRADRVGDVFGYAADWPLLSAARHADIQALMTAEAPL